MNKFKDLFISYGRRESLGFVGRLHQQLKLKGYEAWFDKVNIPDGDDYAQRIDQGIESAHHFVYVMAPRCMTSPYCLLELEYARLLGKRVIPINHMVLFETPKQALSDSDKDVMARFYQKYDLPPQNIQTAQEVLNRSHALIGRSDWLDAKEKLSNEDCQRLLEWAQAYENHWAKHEQVGYLKTLEFPVFGQSIDALSGIVERITAVLERQTDYVHHHTAILTQALHWQKNQKATHHLLVGKEREAAEKWLLTEFLPPKQPPCRPPTVVCDFLCEARKNAENRMADVFICYDVHDQDIRNSVIQSLSRYAITTWTHDRDIQKGASFERVIEEGIENADNFFYFISPLSVTSDYCQKELTHALKYNKRIIPLLIAPTPESERPEILRTLQYVDLTDNTCQADYDNNIDDILNILRLEQEYYKQHKVLLARALKWALENHKSSFLLRGHNLENAQTWFRLNEKRTQHPPLPLHQELISASVAAKGQLGTEVFISYSRKDGDFARQLNTTLQEAGKTTWFDQESISTGVDFEKEIFKGIKSADNFVFVLSPDAVESEYCEREVNYATEHNKRFVTVLHREIEASTMPEALRVINWIDFKDSAFEKSFPELIQAIDLDREHAHQHTVLQQRTSDWAENNQSKEFLLNITACDNAEIWRDRAVAENKQPAPTPLQKTFIDKSREAIQKANRRRNILLTMATAGLIIMVILALFAFSQKQEAEYQKQAAKKSEIKALKVSSKALFESSPFDALLTGLTAAINLQQATWMTDKEQALKKEVYSTLQDVIYGVREYNTLENEKMVSNIAFSPEGYMGSITTNGTLQIWDEKGSAVCTTQTDSQPFSYGRQLSFSSDGKLIAVAGANKSVTLWKTDCTAMPLIKQEGLKTAGDSVLFSSQAPVLVTKNVGLSPKTDNPLRLWKADGPFLKQFPQSLSGPVWDVSFYDKHLALSHQNTVILWNWKEEDEVKTLRQLNEDQSPITSVALYPNQNAVAELPLMVLATNENKTVTLWQSDATSPLATWENRGTIVRFNPKTGTFATSDYRKNTLKLWQANGEQMGKLSGHQDAIITFNFSPDGEKLASASYDQTVKLWRQNNLIRKLYGHQNAVYGVRFSPNGQVLASISLDHTLRLWTKEGRLLAELSKLDGKNNNYLNNLQFLDNQTLIVSFDGHLKIWKQSNNAWKLVEDKKTGITTDANLSLGQGSLSLIESKNRMATTHQYGVKFWQWDDKQNTLFPEQRHKELAVKKSMSMLVFSSDGTLASASKDDHTITLWKSDGTYSELPQKHDDKINDLRFSPNGSLLASASVDTTVKLWQQQGNDWQPVSLPDPHQVEVKSIAFRADGKMLASADSQGRVCFWQTEKASEHYHCPQGHSAEITTVRFSEEAGLWASASFDQTIKLWHREGTLLTTLTGHKLGIRNIDFSSDGKTLASSSNDNTVILWDLEPIKTGELTQLIAHGCRWVQDYLASHPDVDYPLLIDSCPDYLKRAN